MKTCNKEVRIEQLLEKAILVLAECPAMNVVLVTRSHELLLSLAAMTLAKLRYLGFLSTNVQEQQAPVSNLQATVVLDVLEDLRYQTLIKDLKSG